MNEKSNQYCTTVLIFRYENHADIFRPIYISIRKKAKASMPGEETKTGSIRIYLRMMPYLKRSKFFTPQTFDTIPPPTLLTSEKKSTRYSHIALWRGLGLTKGAAARAITTAVAPAPLLSTASPGPDATRKTNISLSPGKSGGGS